MVRILVVDRRFQFHKRGQQLIRTHNETLSVAQVTLESPMIDGW